MTLTEEINNLKQVVIKSKLTNHGVQRVSPSSPRKIVASSTPNIVASPTVDHKHEPSIPIISQENPEKCMHRYLTRSKFTQCPITQSQEHHELYAVIDEANGALLTYRKLVQHPKYSPQRQQVRKTHTRSGKQNKGNKHNLLDKT